MGYTVYTYWIHSVKGVYTRLKCLSPGLQGIGAVVVVGQYEPAGQMVQLVLPGVRLYVPAEHSVGPVVVLGHSEPEMQLSALSSKHHHIRSFAIWN